MSQVSTKDNRIHKLASLLSVQAPLVIIPEIRPSRMYSKRVKVYSHSNCVCARFLKQYSIAKWDYIDLKFTPWSSDLSISLFRVEELKRGFGSIWCFPQESYDQILDFSDLFNLLDGWMSFQIICKFYPTSIPGNFCRNTCFHHMILTRVMEFLMIPPSTITSNQFKPETSPMVMVNPKENLFYVNEDEQRKKYDMIMSLGTPLKYSQPILNKCIVCKMFGTDHNQLDESTYICLSCCHIQQNPEEYLIVPMFNV